MTYHEIFFKKLDEDAFLQQVFNEYLSKSGEPSTGDILTLNNLRKFHYESRRCYSLENEKIYKGWKQFLNNLPASKDEIVPRPDDRYVYKQIIYFPK